MAQAQIDPATVEAIQASFDRQSLMTTFGAWIEEVSSGWCVIETDLSPEHGQQHGFAHAGVTFALGDSAAGYAGLSTMPAGSEVLTAEMKINLIAPARGPRLRAEGWVVKAGRRLVVVQARVLSGDPGALEEVALLQGTMVPIMA